MRRILFLVFSIVLCVFAGFSYINQQDDTNDLVTDVFAAQFDQVNFISNQFYQRLDQIHAQTPLKDYAKAKSIIADAQAEMHEGLIRLFAEAYTHEELKEKQAFERSSFALSLRQYDGKTLQAMQGIGKQLGREVILASITKEFSQKESAQVQKMAAKLGTDTTLPNAERVALIAKSIKTDEGQASVILALLALSKEDVIFEQELKTLLTSVNGDKRQQAVKYTELTRLDAVFANAINQILQEGNIEGGYKNARKGLINFIANTYPTELLQEGNAYFSKNIAQSILEKDVKVAAAIPNIVQSVVARTQTALQTLVEGNTPQEALQAQELTQEPGQESIQEPAQTPVEGAVQ